MGAEETASHIVLVIVMARIFGLINGALLRVLRRMP